MDTLRLPARLESLEPFRAFVLGQIEAGSPLEALSLDVELVLEEVLTNIVSYAYPGREGKIEVQCVVADPVQLRIVIRDWGTPFNPLKREPPNLDADLDARPIGGLGIHLVRQLAREVLYRYEAGANVLTVHIASPEGPRQE